jgi:hypothetical protein
MLKGKIWFRMAALVSLSLALSMGLSAARASSHQLGAADAATTTARASQLRQGVENDPVFLPLVIRVIPPRRIDTGASASYTDTSGNVWEADTGFIGGQAGNHGNINISNTTDPRIYQTERFKLTGYAFAVENGPYTVRLHFAENFYTAAGKRIFSVNVEGTPINNIDVFAEAGGAHIALIRSANVTVADNQLNLSFTPSVGETMIDGIEVLPQ